jgi:hypothetical protein
MSVRASTAAPPQAGPTAVEKYELTTLLKSFAFRVPSEFLEVVKAVEGTDAVYVAHNKFHVLEAKEGFQQAADKSKTKTDAKGTPEKATEPPPLEWRDFVVMITTKNIYCLDAAAQFRLIWNKGLKEIQSIFRGDEKSTASTIPSSLHLIFFIPSTSFN